MTMYGTFLTERTQTPCVPLGPQCPTMAEEKGHAMHTHMQTNTPLPSVSTRLDGNPCVFPPNARSECREAVQITARFISELFVISK